MHPGLSSCPRIQTRSTSFSDGAGDGGLKGLPEVLLLELRPRKPSENRPGEAGLRGAPPCPEDSDALGKLLPDSLHAAPALPSGLHTEPAPPPLSVPCAAPRRASTQCRRRVSPRFPPLPPCDSQGRSPACPNSLPSPATTGVATLLGLATAAASRCSRTWSRDSNGFGQAFPSFSFPYFLFSF